MNVLIRSLQEGFGEREDYFAGGNMFIYYSSEQVRNKEFRGPDFFAVLNVDGKTDRQGWVVWEENGRYPDVIVELMSPSTARIDKGIKKDIYEQVFRTPDYYIFDPFAPDSLQGWHLNGQYQELTKNERGWLWCESLGLWLGTWSGEIQRETAVWLRFYDGDGKLVPLPEEAAEQRAEAAERELKVAQQGLQQGAKRQLLRILNLRFGEVPSNLETSLQGLSVQQLEELAGAAGAERHNL